ncbi:MAG: metal-dependent phosphohydrolase [Lachnospiraceae bacterium]|nr:metal-dependent phosphohydrolase [Lachnospiraceae bacterium]
MWISRYVCLFMVYCCMGWIYETIYCTVKGGKWENRGFLYGPACPIYGVGAVTVSVVVSLVKQANAVLVPWQIFVISVVGSAILEYVTSWALEKTFHALWWDYSRLPFNLHGRISLFTSLGFGFGGLLVVYIIAPFTEKMVDRVTPIWMEVLALLAVAVFVMDTTLTVTALLHFDRMVIRAEEAFNKNMEILVDNAVQRTVSLKQDFQSKQAYMTERLENMGVYVNPAIRRVRQLRYKDEERRRVGNHFLEVMRAKRNR